IFFLKKICRLEPLKTVGNKGKIREKYAQSEILCTFIDDVRTSFQALKEPFMLNIAANWC
ncbi:MAG: hypothetical protein COU46_02315, partial [Candidatus Niyogibacteria bacterium CG10_big_fil_rev_8_21_14_0_10_42_19]